MTTINHLIIKLLNYQIIKLNCSLVMFMWQTLTSSLWF